jgi:2-polyprenyl-3-methyl-5-hydroxy-6-metoxy-1,4-benzoquinol methylase
MFERIDNCPVCQSDKLKNFLICQDFTVSQESFSIVRCQSCSLKFTNPRPTEENSARYYESSEYVSHHDEQLSLKNVLYRMVRKRTLQSKLNLINRLMPAKGALLDIGCGTGAFLKKCKDDQWLVEGVETDADARTKASKVSAASIYPSVFDIPDAKKYNVITMWHVLEHVYKLNETLVKIKKLLPKNGKIIVAVPNSDSLDSQTYKQYWAAYDVPRHLYHFNQNSFTKLLQKHRLTLNEVVPMKYDSYYISLLSAKYKTEKTNYLKAIVEGYQSNRWAASNNKNFSSLTFLISK